MPEIDLTGRGSRGSGPGELRHRSEARPDEGVLLHGSRASGRHRDDSNYDLIRIVAQEGYDLRRDAGQLHERIRLEGGLVGDVLFPTPSRIEAGVYNPGWVKATYRSAHVAFDRNGGIGSMLARMRSGTDRIARDNVSIACG